jgi:protein-arginine kinase activator protein McsA
MDNITVSELSRHVRCDFSNKEFADYAIGPKDRKQLCINVCKGCAKSIFEGLSEMFKDSGTKHVVLLDPIVGFAAPASSDGLTAAVPYTADVSEWFDDLSDAAAYSFLNDRDDDTVFLSGSSLTFLPVSETGNLKMVEIVAMDGANEFRRTVTVNISAVLSDKPPEPNGDLGDGSNTEPGVGSNGNEPNGDLNATGGANEASAENVYTCKRCGATFEKTPEGLKKHKKHCMECAKAEKAAAAAAAGGTE